jgi:hypothetical protein
MNILWAGGEDIDFPITGIMTVTSGARARSGWARGALTQNVTNGAGVPAKTAPFTGGTVTSAWLSFEQIATPSAGSFVNVGLVGFCLSGTVKSLGIGADATTQTKLSLFKYDGTTKTALAAEGGTSLVLNTLQRFDIQVTNYGASATVNVYVNGTLVINFTGDVTVSGMTNFDSIIFYGGQNGGNPGTTTNTNISEIFVADSDTRGVLGLQTLALTGAGTTNAWTNNTFTNINGISFSDSNPTSSNTVAQDQQYTVTTPTPAAYSVIAVTQSARLARPATATPTQVKLGYKNGAGGSFGTGAAKTPGVGYALATQIDGINPVTGVAFTQSDLAALQLCMESA